MSPGNEKNFAALVGASKFPDRFFEEQIDPQYETDFEVLMQTLSPMELFNEAERKIYLQEEELRHFVMR
jgi:hypothetical protein